MRFIEKGWIARLKRAMNEWVGLAQNSHSAYLDYIPNYSYVSAWINGDSNDGTGAEALHKNIAKIAIRLLRGGTATRCGYPSWPTPHAGVVPTNLGFHAEPRRLRDLCVSCMAGGNIRRKNQFSRGSNGNFTPCVLTQKIERWIATCNFPPSPARGEGRRGTLKLSQNNLKALSELYQHVRCVKDEASWSAGRLHERRRPAGDEFKQKSQGSNGNFGGYWTRDFARGILGPG